MAYAEGPTASTRRGRSRQDYCARFASLDVPLLLLRRTFLTVTAPKLSKE